MKYLPRFAFFGTTELSVFALNALEENGLLPALVITAPTRPSGRGLHAAPSPAKSWALKRGIETLEPSFLKDETFIQELANTDWDVFIVAAYAKLIPQALLDMPKKGCLNVHPSLLPALRGPSPVLSTILADERQTGASVMLMEARMDAGPVLAQARIEIAEDEWPLKGSVLSEMLFTEGGSLLAEVLPQWLSGSLTPEAQDESKMTLTRKFTDADACIERAGALSGEKAREAFLKIQAFDKGLRAWTRAKRAGKELRLIITQAHLSGGALVLDRVIPEGKREMDFSEFSRSGGEI